MTDSLTLEQHQTAIEEFKKEFPNCENVVIELTNWNTSFKFFVSSYPTSFHCVVYCALDREWRISLYPQYSKLGFQWSEYYKTIHDAKKDLMKKTFAMLSDAFKRAGIENSL